MNGPFRGVTVDGFKAHRSGAVCNLTLNNVLPARGQYEVTLLVKTTSGASDGSTQPIEIKDWLIVSIGDSFSSGRATRIGREYMGPTYSGLQGRLPVEKRAVWKDRRCHGRHCRHPLSPPSRSNVAMTSLRSLSCRSRALGAKIEHLISEWYRGQEPPAQPYALVLPRIAAVKAAVGDRPIDALL